MTCNKCNKKKSKCGCKDHALESNQGCPPGHNCSDKNSCPSVQDAHCVVYNGPILTDFGINPGDRLDTVLQKIALWTLNPSCVDPANTCQSVLNLLPFSITSTTFGISWTGQVNSTGYQVEYKTVSALSWTLNTVVPTTQFQDTVIGLLPGTTYLVRVNSTCASGSCYSLTISLTTKL